jgi:hypothetical protein
MHMATMALRHKLPKRNQHGADLNGREAAAEYTRGLLPWARSAVGL